MADLFSIFRSNLESPAKFGEAVTPNDGADLPTVSRSLYIGNGGNVNCIMAGSTANTLYQNTQSGSVLPFRVKKIWATGTTANAIVAVY